VARLTQEDDAFDASHSPPRPILLEAAPYDHGGWEKMWRGVAVAGAVAFATVALVLFATYRTVRRLFWRR
jgi:hypothetical protein